MSEANSDNSWYLSVEVYLKSRETPVKFETSKYIAASIIGVEESIKRDMINAIENSTTWQIKGYFFNGGDISFVHISRMNNNN